MKYDICIVGNGGLGSSLAIALSLEDPNLSIGLIGQHGRPRGASPAAGAMHGCFGEVTTGLLHSKLGQRKLEMDIAATALWPEWLNTLNERIDAEAHVASTPGTFVIVNTMSGVMEDRNYDAIKQQLIAHEEPFEEVDPHTIDGLNTAADARPVRALFMPREGCIDSGRLLRGLDTFIDRAPGIESLSARAVSLIMEDDQIRGIELDGGDKVFAATVILAAGVTTHELLEGVPQLAYRIPKVFPGEGCSVLLQQSHPNRIQHVIRTPNRSFACGLHVLPREDDLLYVGATNNVTIRPAERPMVMDMQFLMTCAVEQIDQELYGARAVTWTAGNRPVPIDTMPLIGKTSLSGLWILTGTYRDGLHQSPLLARHLAREIVGRPGLFDNPFQPEREPLPIWTKEEAIQETLMHYDAIGWEHLMEVPKIGWHKTLPRHFEMAIRSVYEELDAPYVLPPEFVSIIDNDRDTMLPFFRNYYQKVYKSWH